MSGKDSRQSRRFYRVDSQHDLLAYLDRGESAIQEHRWTLEIAWEAANKGPEKYLSSKELFYHKKYALYQLNIHTF